MDVGSMHRGVTADSRTVALPQEKGMVHLADDHTATGPGHLCMTSQAQIRIPLHKQLGIYRTMGLVTNGAAFPHGFMFEDEMPGLFSMALGA